MWKENWLVLALAYMIRVFGRLIQQGIILHILLPMKRTERVGWSKERRGENELGRVSKRGSLVVARLPRGRLT